MENKYFTPDIEDFYVGYDCELLIFDKWELTTVKPYTELRSVDKCIKDKVIRVPYLTKEQIEAEGWKYLSEGYPEHQAFYKDDFQMSCFYNKHLLKIIKKESLKTIVLYQGSCRCINDLKKIIKLLEI